MYFALQHTYLTDTKGPKQMLETHSTSVLFYLYHTNINYLLLHALFSPKFVEPHQSIDTSDDSGNHTTYRYIPQEG